MSASGSDASSLGGWTGDDLSVTARCNRGVGADADLPPTVRFQAGVARLIRRRRAAPGADSDPRQPAVFLLRPATPKDEAPATYKRIPMLDNGLTQVTGRLWFVADVVVSGHYIEIDTEDDEGVFTFVTESLEFGNTPAIVYDPRTTPDTARYYENGLMDPDSYRPVAITPAVSWRNICAIIDKVHYECLITPEAQERAGKLWKNSGQWRPSSQAEELVQLYLRVGLTTAFPTCTIRSEQTNVAGRLDLLIEETDVGDASRVTHHAVLELKVLRSRSAGGYSISSNDILEWVKAGVEQAAAYRERVGARLAALCCFDMRPKPTGEQCFDHVIDVAARLQVPLRNWHIFATSQQYRQFTVPSP